ncbi:MAG: AIR synthase-related protein [Pseudomonadales bacterium]|jgi:phosphoribosylformylglycinamidine cyclo-ligase|nr:AIR synthase-related protein [Pseudomonadales bacterium]
MQGLAGVADIKAIAHITGGGFTENIPRVLPESTQAVIDLGAWNRPRIFDWIQQHGNVSDVEMHRTFNCGIGLVICVQADQAEAALDCLNGGAPDSGNNTAFLIGTVAAREADEPAVVLK